MAQYYSVPMIAYPSKSPGPETRAVKGPTNLAPFLFLYSEAERFWFGAWGARLSRPLTASVIMVTHATGQGTLPKTTACLLQ